MRDRMERFVLLPFSVGCISESSIAVAVQHHHQPRRSKPPADHQITNSSAIRNGEEDEESISNESMKDGSFRFLADSKPDRSNGFHRLCKSFKNFSQLFVYKEEIEELEEEMEIGFPTDVKHVTHIGLDGCTTTENNSNKGWDNLIAPGLLSLGQFGLSMAAQAEAEAPEAEALVKNSIHQLN